MKQPLNDEGYTPDTAITPILKYIPAGVKTIWCPFDTEASEYVKVLIGAGYKVITSHIKNDQCFLTYVPTEHGDMIISNPPFSIKDQILKRAYELNKPFMLLLPIGSIGGIGRGRLYQQHGVSLIVFSKRINFNNTSNISFPTGYFCYNVPLIKARNNEIVFV